jgi:phosphopentomutase
VVHIEVVGIERVILLVMDSVGAGATPDADRYGDAGSNTLAHVAEAVGGADLPMMAGLGLGNLVPMRGVAPAVTPRGAFGRMAEASAGKDTATGHWELAGLRIDRPFPTFPDGFPEQILAPFRQRTGRGVLGNRAASGTEIIQELGDQHRQTGDLIVYTSADSVFQIAAHEETVPLDELDRICRIAREILDPWNVGRVIARPFVGARRGEYKRTYNRKDYAMPPPEPTLLDRLTGAGVPVIGVGKIPDIYCHRGIGEEVHTEGNADGMRRTRELMQRVERGLVFVNLVDFDSLYGHRRDPSGYYRCLREFDAELAQLATQVDPGRDLVIITADHGNDPTFPGTDHTREYVPLIAFGPAPAAGVDLGVRDTFADVGATVAEVFQVSAPAHGTSFLRAIA